MVTRYSLLCMAFLVASCSNLVRDDLSPPVTESVFVGEWVGYDDTTTHFYLLSLKADGTGLLGSVYQSTNALRRLLTWGVRDGNLHLSTATASTGALPLSLRADSNGVDIELQIRGDGWEQRARLFRERDFQERIAAVRRAIATGESNPMERSSGKK